MEDKLLKAIYVHVGSFISLYNDKLINDCIHIVSNGVASLHKCLHDGIQATESCVHTCISLYIT